MSDFKKIIKELEAEGITTAKKARGYLAYKYDFDAKETTEILVEAGVSGTRSRGNGLTYDDILEFLTEPKTEKELYEKVLYEGTPNEARWIANRNGIRAVIVKVYENASGNVFAEEAASADLVKEVAARVPAAKAKN